MVGKILVNELAFCICMCLQCVCVCVNIGKPTNFMQQIDSFLSFSALMLQTLHLSVYVIDSLDTLQEKNVMSSFSTCYLSQHTIILHLITLVQLFSICTYSLQVLNKLIFCSEYTKFVLEALELEDTIKNYDRRDATGWFVLTFTLSHY